jgi:hypothetical protein
MSANKPQQRLVAAHQRITTLRESLGAFDYVCSGSLQRRMLPCGNPNCRCKKDPSGRHGPYFYWGRRKGGRAVQMLLTPAEAEIVARAIRNYRTTLRTLRQCEDEIVKIIETRRRLQS